MAKKFFYNRVYNTRRTIINCVIIGVCVIGIIICFIITSNFQGKKDDGPEKVLNIKNEVAVEVNEKYSNEIFFSKIENVDVNEIEIEYEQGFDISKPGKYKVDIYIENKGKKERYNSTLVVIDTTKPTLTTKNVVINEKDSYSANDFVSTCSDNSNFNCIIDFYNDGVDQDGKSIDYSKYTQKGVYTVKIAAKDPSGNLSVEEAQLTINKKGGTTKPSTVTCKYGNDVYDENQYLVAIFVTTNHCAVSLDSYNDSIMTQDVNNLVETETKRIQKDIDALNLKGTFALNRKITAVVNTVGDGVVGYEIRFTVTVTNDNDSKVLADYKLDRNSKRVFTINPNKLSE